MKRLEDSRIQNALIENRKHSIAPVNWGDVMKMKLFCNATLHQVVAALDPLESHPAEAVRDPSELPPSERLVVAAPVPSELHPAEAAQDPSELHPVEAVQDPSESPPPDYPVEAEPAPLGWQMQRTQQQEALR